MNVLTITLKKYYQLLDKLGDIDLTTMKDIDRFRKHYNCSTELSKTRSEGKAMVEVAFETEADLIWFKLKYL